jgi:hypothetical protein
MDVLDIVYQVEHEIIGASVLENVIEVTLKDGRCITLPKNWFTWFMNATYEQQCNFENWGSSLYWTSLDEGFSLETILMGKPKRRA